MPPPLGSVDRECDELHGRSSFTRTRIRVKYASVSRPPTRYRTSAPARTRRAARAHLLAARRARRDEGGGARILLRRPVIGIAAAAARTPDGEAGAHPSRGHRGPWALPWRDARVGRDASRGARARDGGGGWDLRGGAGKRWSGCTRRSDRDPRFLRGSRWSSSARSQLPTAKPKNPVEILRGRGLRRRRAARACLGDERHDAGSASGRGAGHRMNGESTP